MEKALYPRLGFSWERFLVFSACLAAVFPLRLGAEGGSSCLRADVAPNRPAVQSESVSACAPCDAPRSTADRTNPPDPIPMPSLCRSFRSLQIRVLHPCRVVVSAASGSSTTVLRHWGNRGRDITSPDRSRSYRMISNLSQGQLHTGHRSCSSSVSEV